MVGSVAIEQALDFFWTARPEQRQHQQYPGLLRVEFIGRHQVRRIIVYFHIAPNGPVTTLLLLTTITPFLAALAAACSDA